MTQTAQDSSADTVCTNPACGAANRAGTRFCAACGTALAGGAPFAPFSPGPPPPPEPPRYHPAASAYGAVATDRSVDVAMAAEWAYHHALQALQAMNAEISGQTPPSALSAVVLKKAIGNPLRFGCQVNIQPTGPASSRIAYGIKVEWSSTFLMLGLLTAVGAFNLLFLTMSVGLWAPLLSALALGWAVYDYAIAVPNRIGAQLQKSLSGPAVSAQPPAPVTPAPFAPVPIPTPLPTPAPQTVPTVISEDDIVARIEKLAVLKDKGLIDEAEFERRRADLLDRL